MEGDVTNRKCSALTGSARKIKDNAADWHNLMLRWEKANDEGFAIATNIVNLRRSSGQTVEQSSSEHAAITAQLQQECGRLQDIVDKMAAILSKMQRLMASQRGLVDLEDFQFGPEGRKVPLFHSWRTKHFAERRAAEVLQRGAACEAHGPTGSGPQCDPGPEPGLPVVLAAPAQDGGGGQSGAGGHVVGDGSPGAVRGRKRRAL
ncbi:cyclin-dependent kinase 2-interacting protein isoform X1 [Nerophis lumbriciformis]|uniref:cyclin-dependent kinase 2-interacting protein isoform X1 n=1 Tax=Nerophis lumbriciformis TaxID=546530 RepID=UPI002ADF9601|nr:cyclin-dependent kinase 2-interacting protein isoform X1 [Nerophis lumbriciformis]